MFRKLMAGVVLCSVPILTFGAAQVATIGKAWAAVTTECTETAGQVMTFAAPGLSDLGTASASAKSVDKVASAPLTCTRDGKTYSGTFDPFKLTVVSTATCANDPTPPSSCVGEPGDTVVNSASQVNTAFSNLWKYLQHVVVIIPPIPCGGKCSGSVNLNGSGPAGVGSGPGLCPSSAVGFVLTGHLSDKSSAEITTCFNSDTGTGTSGSFANDFYSELAGNTSIDIASVTTANSVGIS